MTKKENIGEEAQKELAATSEAVVKPRINVGINNKKFLFAFDLMLSIVITVLSYFAITYIEQQKVSGIFVWIPIFLFSLALLLLVRFQLLLKNKKKLILYTACSVVSMVLLHLVTSAFASLKEPEYGLVYGLFSVTLFVTLINISDKKWIQNFYNKYQMLCNIVCIIPMSVVTFFIVESCSGSNVFRINSEYWLFNILIYVGIYGGLYLLTFHMKISFVVGLVVATIIGLANGYVILFRGSPILPADLYLIKTAMEVGGNYSFMPTTMMLVGFVMILLLLSLVSHMKEKKRTSKIKVIGRGVVLVVYLLFAGISINKFEVVADSQLYMVNLWQPVKTYERYGTGYAFGLNLVAMQVKKPEGYSEEKVAEILDDYTSDEVKTDKVPNIITILCEAWSDPSVIREFQTNEEYMPYYNSLKENTIKGTAYASVVGGRTANSEYELLTGNAITYLPAGTVPYQQYINGTTDNMTSILKSMGYQALALHPYSRNTYRREIVYPLLGFDEYISQESFENPDYLRYYITDLTDFKKITSLYEERDMSKPFYLFNVTMQNHSAYNTKLMENTIAVKEDGEFEDAEEYLSCIKATDDALRYLIEYFKNVDEPTYILFVGDHQPNLDSGFYDYLFGKTESELSTEEMQKRYAVPFFIWSNEELEEKNIDAISMNYLSTLFMKEAKMPLTAFQKYMLDLYDRYPVVNINGYMDKLGNCFDSTALKQNSRLNEYNMLVYHSIMNNNVGVKEKYELK